MRSIQSAGHRTVAAAAAALRINLVEHSAALQRAETLVTKLDARIAKAQRAGRSRIHQSRIPATSFAGAGTRPWFHKLRRGTGAGYGRRLGVAAGDPAPIMTRVFGDRLPDPQ
jgi:hypothetical protein